MFKEIRNRYTRRMNNLSEIMKSLLERFNQGQSVMNTAEMLEGEDNGTVLKDLGMAQLLRCRVRCFADGAVIGSRGFVEKVFEKSRERFGPKRKDGARKWRGKGESCGGGLWSVRVES